jgi:hypothetical protein
VEIFKVFKLLQDFFKFGAEGVTTICALGSLVMSGLMLFAGWFHYHKAARN